MTHLGVVFLLAAVVSSPAASPSLKSAEAALDSGDFARALSEVQSFVRRYPASAPAHIVMARAHMGLNNGPAAFEDLHKALQLDPNSLDALYYLSKLTAVLSQQEFAAVAKIAPNSARMHQIKAEILEAQGDGDGAEREYAAALQERPGTPYIMNALGDLKRRQKEFAAAFEWYQKTLAKDHDNYDALYGAGACRRAQQKPEEALAFFRRALASDPTSTAAKMAAGESLLVLHDARSALPLLEDAARQAPWVRRLQFLLALAYKAAGRMDDARQALDRARQLPDTPDNAEDLGPQANQ